MKTITRLKVVVCLLMCAGFTPTTGQTPTKQDTPDEALTKYLASFDTSPLKTGIFLNQGFLMDTILHQYRQIKAGTRTTAVNNTAQWQELYVRLTQATVTSDKLSQTPFEELSRIAKKDAPKIGLYDKQELVSLGVIDVTGDYLTKAELEDNRKLKADNVKNTKTYGTLDVFSVAPFKQVVYNANVRFVLNEACYITNKDKTNQTYEIDFGDDQGFRKIKFGTAISVRYKGTGEKMITTRFKLNRKEVFSAAVLTVLAEQLPTPHLVIDLPTTTPKGGRIGQGDTNPARQPGMINSVGPRILGVPMGAQIAIYLGGNCGQVFDKPVIIFEGFDPTNNVDINYLDNKYGYGNNLGSLWNQGFDRVYVNFGDGGDYIENNAQVVQQVIQRVNSIKVGNAPNIVFGESMGGLCARMGLRQMENMGLAHQVSHYISYDSPHRGANFPPGFQAFVRILNSVDFRRWFGIAQSTMNEAFQALDSPAAKQMLLRTTYEIGSTYALNGNSNTFADLQASYDGLGLPQQTRNIAISDGAGDGSSQPGISNGQSYVSGFFMNFLVNTYFGVSSTDVLASNTIA